jgi:uncharacterized membrane protein YeaQ/YmgE (transglycosylase-associated protein family)
MTAANIIAWLVIGAIVGVIFALARQHGTGGLTLLDLMVGVVGGFIGGVILNALGGIVGAEIVGVNVGAGVVALVGAVILVAILELFVRSPEQ